ncbi:hypothetical protein [Corallococcus macrosporus]|nr:hypothetical protein [Corallococcus macrosporus]
MPRRSTPARWMGWLTLAVLGCSSEASKTRAAEAAVRHFFSVLPAGDCEVLAPLLATGGSAKPCVETVRELRGHGLTLVGIVESAVDGRDAEAVLVRARMAHGGRERPAPWLLRVERQGGVWRVRF